MELLKNLVVHGTKEKKKIGGETVEIYTLESSNRDSSNKNTISLEDNNKVIELTLDDGTTWMVDATTMHEVFPELDPALGKSSNRSGDNFEFVLPGSVDAPATERGIIGKIALKLLKVFTKKDLVEHGIENIASRLEEQHLLNNLPEDEQTDIRKALKKANYLKKGGGLFSVNKDFEFSIFDKNEIAFSDTESDEPKPYFLFIHGTNSDTLGAFGDLKNSVVWNTLFEQYEDRVLAFEHRTLTVSPLANAALLADLLPKNAVLHMISHSRGGIVGDIINKYSSENKNSLGFSKLHTDLLDAERELDADGEKKDLIYIKKLNVAFKKNPITVGKFIRVACPAAGTILASKRLDHILNVFTNLLPGTVGDILGELLKAAVQSKDNVDVLPGLEAQNPDSPFLKVLNDPSPNAAIEGHALAVISGNGTASLSGKGLLVILGKLFFWQRNDLVVNTDSMYLGANRKHNIQYFFDQGPTVDHVTYFKNKQTIDAIDLALHTELPNPIPGFASVPQSAIPASDRGLEYGELEPDKSLPSGDRPIVILLPGIMGSNLIRKEKEVWLHYGRIMTGGLTKLDYNSRNAIDANSVVKTSYYKLYKWLSNKYDVIVYPFDWRKPLTDSASEFNEKIESLLNAKPSKRQPIKIIGHSMGGVLVRDFMINHRQTWEKLNDSEGFKLIYLGSPLGGSHRILAVLFGKDAIINKLSKLDLFHSKKRLLKMFSKFPGILALLPLTVEKREDYADLALWKEMRSFFGRNDWPLPTSADLDFFRAYRDGIIEKSKKIDYSNMVYIAGKDKMTPINYYLDDFLPEGKERLRFLYTSEGDQSVSWKLGIPQKLIDSNSVYYTRFTHGALANAPELFDGIEEILSTGKTKLLSKIKPMSRDMPEVFSAEPDIDFDISPAGLESTIFGLATTANFESSSIPLNVTIANGDLRYASYPVLAGHFLNDGILYAEKAIDWYLNKSLTHKHELGLYPGAIGTNAIFETTHDSDFMGSIIVGMGEYDQLTSLELAKTIEQGVLNYLIRLTAKDPSDKPIGISALIMASGYGGLTIENSMKAVINGINQANQKVQSLDSSIYRTVENLEFIERYSDRALNCMYIVNRIVKRENDNYHINIGSAKILPRLGIRRRIPMDTTEDWWNRLTVKHILGDEKSGEIASLVFGASTRDSRQEESRIFSSTPLIDLFIAKASTKNDWDNCTAKTLFELLIPNEMKEKLRRKGHVLWILDEHTASYPWELLQDDAINAKPLCINTGMIRQLSTKDYRKDIKRVAGRGALVVADPRLNGFIGQLPGARIEGEAVKKMLVGVNYPVNALIEEDAAKITTQFFCKDYSIIHLAGHGVFNEKYPNQSGMVIGEKLFLSVFQIQQLPVVPELVFVNCCHLGAVNPDHEEFYRDRYKLAANIGTQLISIGVKAVIAAGWVVNDEAALDFAKKFYQHMFNGESFGDAVRKARSYIYEKHPGNNTWGAYQCYGDPFFKIRDISKGEWNPSYIVPQEAEIDLDNTMNNIEMGVGKIANYLYDLGKIEKAVMRDKETLLTAAVVEKQARIFYQLAIYDKAMEKFYELMEIEKADFSLSALEIYCNARAKLNVQKVYQQGVNITKAEKKKSFEEISNVIKDLKILLRVGQTAERLNMLGSAYKRLSMVAPSKAGLIDALKRALVYYKVSYDVYKKENVVYPLTNAIELSAILYLSRTIKSGTFTVQFENDQYVPRDAEGNEFKNPLPSKLYAIPEALELLVKERNSLEGKGNNEDYWTMLSVLNMDMCKLMLDRNNPNEDEGWKELKQGFQRIWQKAGSEGKKMAEMEHVKILIYALTKVYKASDVGLLPHKAKATIEDLNLHLDTLMAALANLKRPSSTNSKK